jgi:pimeloyl-ACP methyl ester carboxylesterase
MARFPYVDGRPRQQALQRCVAAFEQWRPAGAGIERVTVDLPGGQVHGWAAGLSTTDRRPLLLIMGGIVSVKEQWAPILARIAQLGMAGVVTELPGVGENTLRYDAKSWQMLSGILDALSDRAEVNQTYAMTLSFSGHLALRCAVDDQRIRGVITTGAPINRFFTDTAWQETVPGVTVDTLAALTGAEPGVVSAGRVLAGLADWALSTDQLAALDIPVWYVASRRDEIIPAGELDLLREHVRELHLVANDDVHGSPEHTTETQLWCLLALLRMRGGHRLLRGTVGLLWRAQRTRGRLARPN